MAMLHQTKKALTLHGSTCANTCWMVNTQTVEGKSPFVFSRLQQRQPVERQPHLNRRALGVKPIMDFFSPRS